MGFTSTGIQYWDDTDGPYVNQASQEISASLDPMVNGSFASKMLRDAAYSGMIAAGKLGMTCYVAGYGKCFYDGNTVTGSGGWTWEGAPRILYNAPYGIGAGSDTTPDLLVTSGTLALTSPRILHVTTDASFTVDSGSALGRAFLQASGVTIVADGQEVYMTIPGDAGRGHVSYSTHIKAGPGNVIFNYYMLRVQGSVTSLVTARGWMKVVDLGPTD